MKAYWKNLRTSILKTKSRFLSIFLIVFLGASVFAGLRSTPLTMSLSMNEYLNRFNCSDLTYISTLGFTTDDINELTSIDGVSKVSAGYQCDAQLMDGDQKKGVKIFMNDNYQEDMIDKPDLIEGRIPQNSNECLVDNAMLQTMGYKLGDTLKVSNANGDKEFKIVGACDDTRYITQTDRGTNTLGDGSNAGYIQILNNDNMFLAIPDELLTLRNTDMLYNQISILVDGTNELNRFTDSYDEQVEEVSLKVKSILSMNMNEVYEDLIGDSNKELNSAKKEYEDGLEKYNSAYTSFEKQILEAKIQLVNAKMTLANNESKYLEGKTQQQEAYSAILDQLEESIGLFETELDSLEDELDHFKENPTEENIPAVDITNGELKSIQEVISDATAAVKGIEDLNQAELEIQKAKLKIQSQENKLLLEELKGKEKLDQTKGQLDEAQTLIQEGQEEVDQIPKSKIYTLTIHENAGIMNFSGSVDSISAVAKVFPVLFFLVAALVSLTTMTRMVDEQRGQSGVLRALGYSKTRIVLQYIIYVVLATFFASILGVVFGQWFFPSIIYYLYSTMLFTVNAPVVLHFDVLLSLVTLAVSVLVTLVVTVAVCIESLNFMPATLMRPKAPKMGKRIFLEKIPFIWKKLSFNRKVTIRNIFRYKKRFIMSIVGIAGCTALITIGFGIKYSVSEVIERQFSNVLKYDASLSLSEEINIKEAKENKEKLLYQDKINNVEYIYTQSVDVLDGKENLYASLEVYQSMDNFMNFVSMKSIDSNEKFVLGDEGVVITAKLAELLNVKSGDTIDIELLGEKYNVKISGIVENYFMHYIYMSQNYYENLTMHSMKVNSAYLNLGEMSSSEKESLTKTLVSQEFGKLTYIDALGDDFSVQVDSLDIVIVILIVFAGMLHFIVLYNLTNINIQERNSEIATIKVLGFRQKEVYDYVFRENILLSLIGSFFGLILGYFLHKFIIISVELDMVMFVRSMHVTSYIYAFFMTLLFTSIINYSMRRILNNINMSESLKSIE